MSIDCFILLCSRHQLIVSAYNIFYIMFAFLDPGCRKFCYCH